MFFAVRLRLLAGLRVERELWDRRGPIASLWAQGTFGVRVRLHNDSRLTLYVRERVPPGVQFVGGNTKQDGLPAPANPLTLRYDIFCPRPGTGD